MSDTPYQKECLYCKQKIMMSKESGKWLPYNLNNGQHDCRKDKQATEQQTKKQEKTLEMVQRKLESIGIIINVQRLMRQ